MPRSAESSLQQQLSRLEDEQVRLTVELDRVDNGIKVCERDRDRLLAELKEARILAVRSGDAGPSSAIAAEAAAIGEQIVTDTETVTALREALKSVVSEKWSVCRAHPEVFRARAAATAEAVSGAVSALAAAFNALDVAERKNRAAWNMVRELARHADGPDIGVTPIPDLDGLRREVRLLQEFSPYPRGVYDQQGQHDLASSLGDG